jgi:hypothetical protein
MPQRSWRQILASVHRHGRLAVTTFDPNVRAMLSNLPTLLWQLAKQRFAGQLPNLATSLTECLPH